jgi:hypothetical protein
MLDVHPPHEAAHTWKDFLIHIATIVVGLLIAIGLEQTVEAIHHRREAGEARDSILRERSENIIVLQKNLQRLLADQKQFANNIDLLSSSATDAEILPQLQYSWYLTRIHDAAWSDAKVNGSLALIPPSQIVTETYFYTSSQETVPTIFSYFTNIDTAAALVDHARQSGKLPPSGRQQLLSVTTSAMGLGRIIYQIDSIQLSSLQTSDLR